ncbi:MAG: hypothetical protein U0838_07075 [Chloroflexota bacterium]
MDGRPLERGEPAGAARAASPRCHGAVGLGVYYLSSGDLLRGRPPVPLSLAALIVYILAGGGRARCASGGPSRAGGRGRRSGSARPASIVLAVGGIRADEMPPLTRCSW